MPQNGEIQDSDAMYRVAECIIFIRPTYLCARSLTYLLTYLHSWLGPYKTGNISETVEDRAKVLLTAYIKSHMLSFFVCRQKVIDSLNATKMAKCSLIMTPTPHVESFAFDKP